MTPELKSSLLKLRKAGFSAAGEALKHIEAVEAERDQLRAEVEALRADAERYRWLRDKSPGAWTFQVGDLPLFKGDLNAAIDRERG